MIFLPRCAAALAPLACGANGRQAMGCLRLREAANAHFRLEATDGKVLGILRGPSSPSAAERRAAESLPEPECLALEALLPRKGFQEAMRPLKGEARLGVRLARPQTLLVAGASVTRLDGAGGRYPDVDGALPKRPAPVSFKVDAGLLIRLLKAAGAVAASGDSASVEILFWSKDKPVGVITRGDHGLTFDGLIMPLS